MKVRRFIGLFFINKIFKGTRFFFIKYKLAIFSGIKLGHNVKIVGPIIMGNCVELEIGDESWVGRDLKIYGNGSVIIGKNCDLAPDVSFYTGGHIVGMSTRRAGEGTTYKIKIEDGCWICGSVKFFNNIVVSSGSIIALGSVVGHDCEPNSVYAGVPAIKKKDLF